MQKYYYNEGLKIKNITETHQLSLEPIENGLVDYLEAVKEWQRNGRPGMPPKKDDFLFYKVWEPKCDHREFYLKEKENGDMLLHMQVNAEELYIRTDDPDAMGNYLYEFEHEKKSLEEMRDIADWDAVPKEENYPVLREWLHEKFAINHYLHDKPQKAGANAMRAWLVAQIKIDPTNTLKQCESASEILAIVEEFEDLICPVPFTAKPEDAHKRHKIAWELCRIMHSKSDRATFENLQKLVYELGELCKILVGAEHITLAAFRTEDEEMIPCSYEEADIMELNCSRVSLRGYKPFDLAERIAQMLNGRLMQLNEAEQDGDTEWFYYKKRK